MVLADHLSNADITMGNLVLIAVATLCGAVVILAAWVARLSRVAPTDPGPGRVAVLVGFALTAVLVLWWWSERRGFQDLWHNLFQAG